MTTKVEKVEADPVFKRAVGHLVLIRYYEDRIKELQEHMTESVELRNEAVALLMHHGLTFKELNKLVDYAAKHQA